MNKEIKSEVIWSRGFDMQICVPADWTNEQVKEFSEKKNPCGTEHGWHIRRNGDPALNGDPERRKCITRDDYVHIMLDA